MPLYTHKDLAKHCGISGSNLTTYRTRGKVTCNDAEMYDSEVEPNKSFIVNCLAKKKEKQELLKTVPPALGGGPSQSEEHSFDEGGAEPITGASLNKLMVTEKQVKIAKTNEEIDILKLRKKKITGMLIPTDLTRHATTRFAKSVSTSFHQAGENLIIEMATELGLTTAQIAALRTKLVAITNKSVADAVAESKADIRNIVNEYAETRAVGERRGGS